MSKTHFAQAPWWPLKRCLWATLALLLAPLVAHGAANKTTVTGNPQTLDFGGFSVLPSCANCSITIGTDGSRTATAGIVLINTKPGKAATYTIICNNGACAYSATVSPSTVSMPAGGVAMTVGNFQPLQSGPKTPNTVTVGARLVIPNSGSVPNTYTSGSFTVATSP